MDSMRYLFIVMFVLASASGSEEDEYIEGFIKIPDVCKGKLFCSIKPEGYDKLEAHFEKLLPKSLLNEKVEQRNGDHSSAEKSFDVNGPHCPYSVKKEVPYIINLDGNSNEVVIQSKKFRQEFTFVTCKHDLIKEGQNGEECFQDHGFIPMHVKPTCQNSHTMQTVFIYKNEILNMVHRPVPSCCSCQLKDTD